MLAIDQRGRIQLSREMLNDARISDRARAEVVDEGILLRGEDDDVH